jgi:PhnB protein
MPMSNALPAMAPLLVVRDAARAIDFYGRALGAREVVRYTKRNRDAVAHADLALGEVIFSVTEEARAYNSDAPPSLGGSPVVLQLRVADVVVAFDRMCAAGATVAFPIVEFCGERMARLRDPFGHLWLITQRVEELSPDEVQRQRDAWMPPGRPPKT